MSKESYARGFVKVAQEHGVDPVQLIKVALSDGAEDALNFAIGASAGGVGGVLMTPLTGLAGFSIKKELENKADMLEREGLRRLKGTDPQYKALYQRHLPDLEAANSARTRLSSLMDDLEGAELDRAVLNKAKVSTTAKEKLLHPLAYRKIVQEGNRAEEKLQSLQNAESKLRAEIGTYEASARPLHDRVKALRGMAGKKIGPRMVRAGGRLAPWIGMALPIISMAGGGGLANVYDERKKRGSNPKKQ